MNPFEELNVPLNCPIDVAKAAYRRLAQVHHPDKVPDCDKSAAEIRFKAIKAAWERIEGGYKYEPPRSQQPPPHRPQQTYWAYQAHAEKPASGYAGHRTGPVLPHTYVLNPGAKFNTQAIGVKIEITADQAFEGCTVPFWHDGTVREYIVLPGTTSRTESMVFPKDPMIGRSHLGMVTIQVELIVQTRHTEPHEQTRDAEMELPLCALGLFTGGKVTVQDHLGKDVSITIPPGHDPSTSIIVPDHGYGMHVRGRLIVKVVPVFKLPTDLNFNERQQLQRLNEMSK